jgi:CubicO group peptidase (beta-lactamase class C family)
MKFSSQLLNKIDQKANEENFTGIISLHQEDQVVYERAFGYRDYANQVANNTDTRFGIASGTKLFTALGIARLIEKGKLSLDTTVGNINTDFSGYIDPKATIQQLLSHSSGMYDYFDEELIEDWNNVYVDIPWYQLENPSDYLPLFEGQKFKFTPGDRYCYSNGGYVFLGIIIEQISGRPYSEFIQDEILKPAEMLHSGFFAMNKLPENTAFGYKEDRETTNHLSLPIKGGGDGGMFTTAQDLNNFWRNFMSGKIIGSDLLTQFKTTRYELDEKSGYGLGLYKHLDDSKFYIVGGDTGVGFYSGCMPNDDITISIISNVSDGEEEIRDFLSEELGF